MLEQQRPQQAAIARCLGNLAALRDSKGYEAAQHRARSSISAVCRIFGRGAQWDSKRKLYAIVRQACYAYLDCPGSNPVSLSRNIRGGYQHDL